MSIVQIGDQNFYLGGHHNKTLNINLNGFVLVFFKMQNCPGCNAFEPIFQQLSQNIRTINYAICDISIHKNPISLSRNTNNEIKAVPWIVFYSDGIPVAKYNGKKNIPSLKGFINKVIPLAQQRKQQTQKNFMPQPQRNMHGGQPMQTNQKYYAPDLGQQAVPFQSGAPQQPTPEEEDDDAMIIPEGITPHNKPWESYYKQI